MIHVHSNYGFHPVGQGLFSSGCICTNDSPHFNWVFDCGTASSLDYLRKQIGKYKVFLSARSIGLFCLSHFDKDHVNGARELLSLQRVDTLAMPYFPLVERMAIALADPDLTNDYLAFLVDPAGYMYAAAGDNLGNVIFITGGDNPPETPDEPITPDSPDDSDWDLQYPDTKVQEAPDPEDLHGVSDSNTWRAVRVFTHAKPFTVDGVWEFMFYNEHIPDKRSAALRKKVSAIIRKHKRSNGSFDGDNLIDELEIVYEDEFGSTGVAKNRISLVVYTGPLNRSDLTGFRIFGGLTTQGAGSPYWPYAYDLCDPAAEPCKMSVGYFGDFPLTSLRRLNKIKSHFGKRRWSWIEVVQIPHHGSRHSWFPGARAHFEHQASLISSARLSAKLPSQEVLDDLTDHGLMLVNEIQGARFLGHVQFE